MCDSVLGFPGSAGQGYAILTANQVPPGEYGYFLASMAVSLVHPAGSQGFLCLGGNIGRYNQPQNIGQGPSFSIQVDLTSMPVNPPLAVQPGDTWHFQAWYRDNSPFPSYYTSDFTDAVAVTFQ